MRIDKIVNALWMLCVLTSAAVKAEGESGYMSDSGYRNSYGIVDQVYGNESRLIIADTNFHYGNKTLFENAYGSRIDNITRALKPGTPVSYYYYRKSSKLVLKELRVVSLAELKRSKRDRERY